MRPRSSGCLSAALAVCVLLSGAVQAQVIPFGGNFGPGLSPEDNRLLFESIARLNTAEPAKAGMLWHQQLVTLRQHPRRTAAIAARRLQRAGKGPSDHFLLGGALR